MQNLPILYSFVRCPYAMRARFALVYSNIKCALIEVDLKNKPEELLKTSPKGTVPVLYLPSGQVIDQSIDIINYALSQNDPDAICNVEPDDQKIIDRLTNKNDTIFAPLLNKYKYFNRHPEESQSSYREQIEIHFLQQMNTQLELFPYLIGQKLSVADIAIFPFIRQFTHVDPSWPLDMHYKSLATWLERFTKAPSFEIIMQKNTPWVPGDPEVIFHDNPFEIKSSEIN